MNEELTYRHLAPITEAEASQALASGVPSAITNALLRLALYSPNVESVEGLCLRYSESSDAEIRRAAVLALGHLARLHGIAFKYDDAFLELISRLDDQEKEVRGAAIDALSDLQIFRWKDQAYSREVLTGALESGSEAEKFFAIFHVSRYDANVEFVWSWCARLLQNPSYALRAAALWAIAEIWDRSDSRLKTQMLGQVNFMLGDHHWWVRDSAQQVLDAILRSSSPTK